MARTWGVLKVLPVSRYKKIGPQIFERFIKAKNSMGYIYIHTHTIRSPKQRDRTGVIRWFSTYQILRINNQILPTLVY